VNNSSSLDLSENIGIEEGKALIIIEGLAEPYVLKTMYSGIYLEYSRVMRIIVLKRFNRKF
jgi:hypothetical protein